MFSCLSILNHVMVFVVRSGGWEEFSAGRCDSLSESEGSDFLLCNLWQKIV
jgi:hypothetical protein